MKKSILFVTNSLGWGGAESQVIVLALRLRDRGWNVKVATLVASAERRQELESHGVNVRVLGMKRGRPNLKGLYRLVRLVRENRPAVVHSHVVHANFLCRIARLFCHVPVLVSTVHSTNEEGRWRGVAYRITDPLCDITTNVSKLGTQQFVKAKKAPKNRIRYIPNGLDYRQFEFDSASRDNMRSKLGVGRRFVWLCVGRFDAAKDYPGLVYAFARIAQHSDSPLLVIVGDGPLRASIQERINQAGLNSGVWLLGQRSDVSALMHAADGYVMSSAWEGMPMVLLEAAAAALPVVATDAGDNAEIVNHEISGEIVPRGDPNALASAMERMMELPLHTRKAMGRSGAEHVQECFGLDGIVDRWESLYDELAELNQEKPSQ